MAGVVGGTVCLGTCGGTEGSGRVVGMGVLAEMARGGNDIGVIGTYLSSGSCITGADPVGVTGKAGVEDEMIGDGGRAGCIAASLPVTTGGTGSAFDSDCCGGWLRYVGLFIVSIPLRDGGLTAPGDG